jgi:hypothetical protein
MFRSRSWFPFSEKWIFGLFCSAGSLWFCCYLLEVGPTMVLVCCLWWLVVGGNEVLLWRWCSVVVVRRCLDLALSVCGWCRVWLIFYDTWLSNCFQISVEICRILFESLMFPNLFCIFMGHVDVFFICIRSWCLICIFMGHVDVFFISWCLF